MTGSAEFQTDPLRDFSLGEVYGMVLSIAYAFEFFEDRLMFGVNSFSAVSFSIPFNLSAAPPAVLQTPNGVHDAIGKDYNTATEILNENGFHFSHHLNPENKKQRPGEEMWSKLEQGKPTILISIKIEMKNGKETVTGVAFVKYTR